MISALFPSRFVNLDQARAIHGDRVDRYARFFFESDFKAEAAVQDLDALGRVEAEKLLECLIGKGLSSCPEAPPSLKILFEELEQVPFWVDWKRIELGAETLLRAGMLGPMVLLCRSLPLSYCMPAGNKPLALTGELIKGARQRIHDTGIFIYKTCLKDGLRRGGAGYRETVRVRLIHARVSSRLKKSSKWKSEDWGLPVNQADLGAASLLFSYVLLEGLRKLGFQFNSREINAVMHLWKYSGYLTGVDVNLLCDSEDEARVFWDLVMSTQAQPDSDSITLAKAILEIHINEAADDVQKKQGKPMSQFLYGLSRYLIGEPYAKALDYPSSGLWKYSGSALQLAIRNLERARLLLPVGNQLAIKLGEKMCKEVVEIGLVDIYHNYDLRRRLLDGVKEAIQALKNRASTTF